MMFSDIYSTFTLHIILTFILDTHLVVAGDPVLVDGNVFGVQELAAGAVLAWNTMKMF